MALRIKQVTPLFSVGGQISQEDLDSIAAHGFALVINNRPDAEEDDQPDGAVFEAPLAERGIEYVRIPVVTGQWHDDSVAAFRSALERAGDRKVFAFCRSGVRAAAMWVLAADPDEKAAAHAAVAEANIDLSKIGGLGSI